MPIVYLAAVLLGLAVGSFLNVVIHRVPAELSLSSPPSRCPACEQRIRARHNVPLLGWLLLRGRCADCRAPISPRYPLVELGTALLFVALAWQLHRLHLLAALPTYWYFAAISIALALIDVDVHRLPNAIVLPSYLVVAFGLTLGAVALDQPAYLLRAAICGLALFGCYFVLAFSYPAGMGFGDVKLAGLIGAVLGFVSYRAALVGAFTAFVLGGIFGVALLARRRAGRKTAIPFGPFMIAGAVLAIFVSMPVGDWYARTVLGT
ncbi:MAG TPA: prepilin peptidase [Jatrophihabitans sp.]|nr:prepilin peptidase [Jatrophihabitans sp.]